MNYSSIIAAVNRGDAAKLARDLSAEDANAREADGRTPLMYAVLAERPSPEVIETLVERGADVNAADNKGWTALHFAAQSQDADSVRALLRAGAEVDPRNANGATPLLRSVRSAASAEVVRLLLEAGADPTAEDKWGSTSPLHLANKMGKAELEALMLKFKPKGSKKRSGGGAKKAAKPRPAKPALGAGGKGWSKLYQWLWDELVPVRGQAPTVQGELLRCIGKVTDEAYRNGNLNWDENYEAMVRFVGETLDDPETFSAAERAKIRRSVAQILKNVDRPDLSGPGSTYYYLTEQATKWCEEHPEPIPRKKNPKLKK